MLIGFLMSNLVLVSRGDLVANDVSSADNLTEGEETEDLDTVGSVSESVSLGDGLSAVNDLLGLEGVRLDGVEQVLVDRLELRKRGGSKALLEVDLLSELTGDLGPVDGTVGDA